jgi:hypothetical protein
MFNLTVVGDKETADRYRDMPAPVRAIIGAKLVEQGRNLAMYIETQKLSGQVLKARSSSLRASITAEGPIEEGSGLYERVFSSGDVKYAAFWEFGFHGTEAVRAYERLVKDSDNPKGFKTVVQVRAHDRQVNQAARPFMRPSLAENAKQIGEELQRVTIEAMRKAVKGG